ncbi:hypothetical protein JCM19237_5297 [Photobacterium aphoticum]|uniref:Uncharacterized protein n=1 Tax=Photobacterium aphoticum TaxID=754436 RepID=A0A090QKR1_9GAMM|nr:hypothetical protein JCM19237_5297 [Photobacterium aphoticum]
MLQLTEAEVLDKIQQLIPFEAQLNDGSLTIRISEYQPYIATAIHHGHRLRGDLMPNCLLNEDERYFEEDPFTGDFISSLPIVLQGEDSRYEYDLNRGPDNCIYEEAWGKPVWSTPLTDAERAVSLENTTPTTAFWRVWLIHWKAISVCVCCTICIRTTTSVLNAKYRYSTWVLSR